MRQEEVIFTVNGVIVRAKTGQTILSACNSAGVYIPRLCHHPDLKPAGHCRLCVCNIDGRRASACTMPAASGMVVISDNEELNDDRRAVLEMLFVEGNHFCPTCERSGDCELQALAYRLGITSPSSPINGRDASWTRPIRMSSLIAIPACYAPAAYARRVTWTENRYSASMVVESGCNLTSTQTPASAKPRYRRLIRPPRFVLSDASS